jgi:hypothetical protein
MQSITKRLIDSIGYKRAVPTCYRGTTFRSRLEADAAFLFDHLGLGWEFEAHSFLLDNGLHYRPDFLVASRSMWAETRGYSNVQGDTQIAGFTGWIHSGRPEPAAAAGPFPDCLVIGPEVVMLHEYEAKWGITAAPAILMLCGNCGRFGFLAQGGEEGCKARCKGSSEQGPDRKWPLGIERGALLIAGRPFTHWLRAALGEGILTRIGEAT